jgi:hypothetical protein
MTPGIGGVPGDVFSYLMVGALCGFGVLLVMLMFAIALRILGFDWRLRNTSPSVKGSDPSVDYVDQIDQIFPSGLPYPDNER